MVCQEEKQLTLVRKKLARSDNSFVKSCANFLEDTLLQKRSLPQMKRTTVCIVTVFYRDESVNVSYKSSW